MLEVQGTSCARGAQEDMVASYMALGVQLSNLDVAGIEVKATTTVFCFFGTQLTLSTDK